MIPWRTRPWHEPPPLTRRRFLGFSALFPWLPDLNNDALSLAARHKDLKMEAITSEELELIKNPLSRKAWFAKQGLPQDSPLEIRQRVFGNTRKLLRDADIENVHFVDCTFKLFQGYGNNLNNAIFKDCQFLGGVFSGNLWKNVRLLRCHAEGPFQLGAIAGEITYEDCDLRGMSKKEGGYGNWADHFGLAGCTDGISTFLKCKLQNARLVGAKSLRLIDCDIDDLYANTRSQNGELIIEGCKAKGRQMFGGGGNHFSRIAIKNSQLGEVNMMSASARQFEIIDSKLSLKMGAYQTEYGNAVFRNVAFFGEGLRCPLATRFDTLLLENCSFDASSKGLQLFGEPNDRPSADRPDIYWTRIRHLTLRKQKLSKPQMAYLQLGTFTMEQSSLEDANLAHGRFGTWSFTDARLSGTLDLTETTIRQITNNGLSNTARLNGKLEADAAAPLPDTAPSNVAKPGNGNKPVKKP